MKALVYDAHPFERPVFEARNQARHELAYLAVRLTADTAPLAKGYGAVVSFANDRVDAPALDVLKGVGVGLLALRCAGYNHVDVAYARRIGLPVVRVPAYSPYAVAEHAVALLLCLNRKIHRAVRRVAEGNFSVDGLTGFDVHGKTVGIVGLGKIGRAFASIMRGFGTTVLASDPRDVRAEGVVRVPFAELCERADVISLHAPLTPETRHLIDDAAIERMKRGVCLVNTGRGGLIDAAALIRGLKAEKIGAAGLDVYEWEQGVFFEDHSLGILQDDTLARLLTFPNVIVTPHQAFLTHEAVRNIVDTTLENLSAREENRALVNEVPG